MVSSAGKAPRRETNHGSIYQRFPARTEPFVVFAHLLLFWSIQAIVRSTTHLRGSTTKPLGGNSLCQSTATPSLAHSLASLTCGWTPATEERAREPLIRSPQERLDPFVIHHLCAMDLHLEDETLSVHQDVALTALDLLASVVAALFSAHRGTLDRLAIHHARAGLRIPPQAHPQPFADGPVDPLPGAVDTPSSEVVVDGGPPGKVVGKQAPLATALQYVKDGVQDLAKAVGSRASLARGGRQVRFDVAPFSIGKIRWVRFSHAC